MAATLALDFAYHRRDINCWQVSGKTMEDLERWPELDVDNGEVFQTANSRCFSIPVIHTNHQQHEFHTWRNVVPLTVDCERNLRLIGTIHLEHADNRDEDIKLPWVNAAASRPDLVGEVALSAPQPGRDAGAYLQWTRLDGGQLVSWEAVQDGAVRRNVAAIPPASAIYATLLPCNQPMYAYWRIHGKQSESFVDVLLGDGVSAQRGTPLAHYSATAAWKPVTVEIKPHSVPQCLVVRGGAAGCMLTQPLNTRTQ